MENEQVQEHGMHEDNPEEKVETIRERWASAGGDIEVSPAGLRARAESLRIDAQSRFEQGEEGSEALGMQADDAEADANYLETHGAEALQ